MAWRRPGDKPLSEPMMVNLLTHICVKWVYAANRKKTDSILSFKSIYVLFLSIQQVFRQTWKFNIILLKNYISYILKIAWNESIWKPVKQLFSNTLTPQNKSLAPKILHKCVKVLKSCGSNGFRNGFHFNLVFWVNGTKLSTKLFSPLVAPEERTSGSANVENVVNVTTFPSPLCIISYNEDKRITRLAINEEFRSTKTLQVFNFTLKKYIRRFKSL